MKKILTLLVAILFMVIPTTHLDAQDEGFIYGKVFTIDNRTYEGPIRWGKEEVYWVDIFNAGKQENTNLRYLSSKEREDLCDRQYEWYNWNGDRWNWSSWFDRDDRNNNRYENDFEHQFACQFGEIKTIIPSGRKYVDIEMQNGDKVTLKGEGYNDVGLEIRIMDSELGEVDMSWGRIEKIEFMKTPKNITNKFGKSLYGTVEAFGGSFTGYIQWDHDERLSTDKLDGETDDGDVSIEFGKIVSIERNGGASLVVLKSGRELRIDGTNDVDNGNRGIIIMNKEMVAVDVPWREFDKVTFTDNIQSALSGYETFTSQQALKGTLETQDGRKISGKIVFDLDEEFSYELLQGKKGELEFITPFRNIKKIEPLSSSRCSIELKSGNKITLDDAQDVNERNQGILVFTSKSNEPVYILWEDVKQINLDWAL